MPFSKYSFICLETHPKPPKRTTPTSANLCSAFLIPGRILVHCLFCRYLSLIIERWRHQTLIREPRHPNPLRVSLFLPKISSNPRLLGWSISMTSASDGQKSLSGRKKKHKTGRTEDLTQAFLVSLHRQARMIVTGESGEYHQAHHRANLQSLVC